MDAIELDPRLLFTRLVARLRMSDDQCRAENPANLTGMCGCLVGDEIHGPSGDCSNDGAMGPCINPVAHHDFVQVDLSLWMTRAV
jgi:hypothetical protein